MSLRAERLDAGTWLMGPLAWNKKVGLPSRLSQTTERQATDNYSQALKSNKTCPASF